MTFWKGRHRGMAPQLNCRQLSIEANKLTVPTNQPGLKVVADKFCEAGGGAQLREKDPTNERTNELTSFHGSAKDKAKAWLSCTRRQLTEPTTGASAKREIRVMF